MHKEIKCFFIYCMQEKNNTTHLLWDDQWSQYSCAGETRRVHTEDRRLSHAPPYPSPHCWHPAPQTLGSLWQWAGPPGGQESFRWLSKRCGYFQVLHSFWCCTDVVIHISILNEIFQILGHFKDVEPPPWLNHYLMQGWRNSGCCLCDPCTNIILKTVACNLSKPHKYTEE